MDKIKFVKIKSRDAVCGVAADLSSYNLKLQYYRENNFHFLFLPLSGETSQSKSEKYSMMSTRLGNLIKHFHPVFQMQDVPPDNRRFFLILDCLNQENMGISFVALTV